MEEDLSNQQKLNVSTGILLLFFALPSGIMVYKKLGSQLYSSEPKALNMILKVQHFYGLIFGSLTILTSGITKAFDNPFHVWISDFDTLKTFCTVNAW